MTALGTKRHCPECQSKFYDMGAVDVRCPKCEFIFPIHLTSRETPLPQAVTTGSAASKKPRKYKLQAEEEKITGLGDVVELEDFDDDGLYDDIDHLEEVEDHHENPEQDINGDDAEDDMFIDEIAEDDIHLIDEPEEASYDEREAL